MTDKQYGYRFYDTRECAGPLPRDEVLAKLRDDLATIPVERHQLTNSVWSSWHESHELMAEVCPPLIPVTPTESA